jgi:hypothetical protein
LTHIRRLPSPTVPTESGSAPAVDEDTDLKMTILWDAWHAQFADLARDPILKSVGKLNNPSGEDTVEITVTRNHHVFAHLSNPGKNKQFDDAILQSYQSLDGDPRLEYPPGSRRRSITFLIDNEHKEPGAPTAVKSQTTQGDKEVLHHH